MSRNRGYNREQRERVVKNRKRLMRDTNLQHKHDEDGRYVKRHPYDCGNADCGLCHAHKRRGCGSKWKDEHGKLEEILEKELRDEMCDFGD